MPSSPHHCHILEYPNKGCVCVEELDALFVLRSTSIAVSGVVVENRWRRVYSVLRRSLSAECPQPRISTSPFAIKVKPERRRICYL